MEYIYIFGLSLFISTVLAPFFRHYAAVLKLIDEPNESRKVHKVRIPRSGGLSLIIGVFVATALWVDSSRTFVTLCTASIVILIFGYLDDSRNLNYMWKLFGQLIASLILIAGGVTFHKLPFFGMENAPAFIAYPFSLFFLLGVTNAVNLSDGLDGLAAGNALLSLLLIALLSSQIGNIECLKLALAIIGGLLGFLRYNTHPAKIFMGDTGSQFLGMMVGALAIILTQDVHSAFNPILPVLIVGLPILDTVMVMVLRVIQGRFIFAPDQNHLHHQLLKLSFRHYEVVAILYTLQVFILLAAYVMRYELEITILLFYSLFCTMVCSVLFWGRTFGYKFRSKYLGNAMSERRNLSLKKVNWRFHNAPKVLLVLITLVMIACVLYPRAVNVRLSAFCLSFSVGLMCVCFVFRTRYAESVARVIAYASSTCVICSFTLTGDVSAIYNVGVDCLIAMILVTLLLAIRLSENAEFHLDTQDYLLIVLLFSVPHFTVPSFDTVTLTRLTLRVAVIIYTYEFLLFKKRNEFTTFNTVGIAGLLVLGLQPIIISFF